jgi:hypothetical protein
LRRLIKERNIANIGEQADSLHVCRAINVLRLEGVMLGQFIVKTVVRKLRLIKPIRNIAVINATMNMVKDTEWKLCRIIT